GQRPGESLVRYMRGVEAQAQLEELHADVVRRAVARRAEVVLAGIRADERDGLLQVVRREHRRVDEESVGGGRDLADRREVARRVVGQVLEERRCDGVAVDRYEQ